MDTTININIPISAVVPILTAVFVIGMIIILSMLVIAFWATAKSFDSILLACMLTVCVILMVMLLINVAYPEQSKMLFGWMVSAKEIIFPVNITWS